jgi:predicted nucleic acid-binding protein
MSNEAGLMAQVKPLLDELRKTGFRMSSTVCREALVKAPAIT